jgi:arabinofuranosyltransferase
VPGKFKKATSGGFAGGRFSRITKRLATSSAYAFAVVSIGTCFVAWASVFIYRSSFVGIDGRRYFSLFDDAMISMRYAWNLSHGWGLVWNPGEYVEGYTNPLMTLLMSLATLAFDKVEAVLAVQVLGIVFVLVNAYLVMSIAKHLVSGQERYRGLFLVLAFLCALSYYPLVYFSLMGMETGLLAVLLSLSVLFSLRYVRDRRPVQGVLLSVFLGLAFLTRPDAVVFAIPVFIYVFYAVRKSERTNTSLSFLLAMVGLYVLFIVGQELFRWGYYGEWLPNTYTLKVSGIPLLTRIVNGIKYVGLFLREIYVLLIVVGAGIVFAFRRDKLFLASFFVVLVCYQVWAGGDPWDYWRLMAPAVPIMLVLGAHEILMALDSMSETEVFRRYFLRNPLLPRRQIPGALACLLVLVVLWSVNTRFLPEIAMLQTPHEANINARRVQTALAIEQVTTPEATVGVFAAGAIPYYSGRPAIDFLGKSDRHIARLPPDLSGSLHGIWTFYRPGHNKYDLEYSIEELKPTYVEGFSWGGQNVVDWADSEYVRLDYEGVPLYLLEGSGAVRWDKIEQPPEAIESTSATDLLEQ